MYRKIQIKEAVEYSTQKNGMENFKAEANYFAIFDGHAGTGAALMASNCLHEHIRV